uniref:Uncharacterized protein n=1 Tax=Rhizophora mucronata TaxID=61149 RepID=A0A2P2IXU5_RHIMU
MSGCIFCYVTWMDGSVGKGCPSLGVELFPHCPGFQPDETDAFLLVNQTM